MPRKILLAALALVFAYFSWLQVEDYNPEVYVEASGFDAVLWILSYALVAALFVLAIFKKFPKWLFLATALVFAYHLIATLPGVWENITGDGFDITKTGMAPDNSKVELSREFFGALIALAALAGLWCCGRGKCGMGKKGEDQGSPSGE